MGTHCSMFQLLATPIRNTPGVHESPADCGPYGDQCAARCETYLGHDCNVAARLIPKTGTPAPPAKGLAAIPGASMGWGTHLPKAAAPVKKAAKAATKKK